jgi:hypothetical protein
LVIALADEKAWAEGSNRSPGEDSEMEKGGKDDHL